MSLAEIAKVTPIAPAVRNRILILDVERLPGLSQQSWWDRGDLKNRYIHHETVTREPRTTILCAKWYDQPDVMRFAEWDKGGRKVFLKRIHALMAEADIIVGHNLDQADVPWLKGDFYLPRIGHPHRPDLPPLPPFKTVDTLKVLRRELRSGAPFKSLDAFCKIVGIPAKTDKYDRDAMERAVAGSDEDRLRLTDYCEGDVVATQWLYDWERPHIKNHPALFVDGEDKLTVCNRCGSETKPIAKRYVANVMTYSMRKCVNCSGHSRISIDPERLSMVRGV
ncbi:MAG: hypothetical protein JWP74_1749 [Marmoricola sp.]|nr:hypothetical protein [Marmoricola sp.]